MLAEDSPTDRELKLAELKKVIEFWSTTADAALTDDGARELHTFSSVSEEYRQAMQSESQLKAMCTNGIILHQASLRSRHCKLALQYGNILWIGGLALAKFLSWCATDGAALSLHHVWKGSRVLELGAGTGVVGLTLGRLGATVTLTDNETEVIALLKRNISANELSTTVNTRLLDFGDATTYLSQEFDVIVAADVLYNENQAKHLANTLDAHVRRGVKVFLSYEKRAVCHQAFFTEVVAMGLRVERLEDAAGSAVWDATHMAAKVYGESQFVSLDADWVIPASSARVQIFRLSKP
jgi:predicted nicotinamide N-methyase